MDKSSSSSPTYSERYADVTISSSDGVLFKLHRKNLEVYSEGFPGTDVPVHGEVVALTEKASTLELLFQYMYRERQPDLGKVHLDELALLAEAAEKYLVYSAMGVCKVHMQLAISVMPLKVLGYAAKHSYESLCVDAAQLTIDAKAVDALQHMDLICFAKWASAFAG
ncbi:hypothetical protein DAEQUDRAFT_745253 [Daedalea quercina L-15889]|uniref:BTB domain-containing protein n=1 Tax=Daedalea quercina L-15889 TaxID=1314783 RepID=A0A165QGT1_9APHY|nr:hypothetical protein DAEQUDRAFT_745253 [Daedalea quercina L-15889]